MSASSRSPSVTNLQPSAPYLAMNGGLAAVMSLISQTVSHVRRAYVHPDTILCSRDPTKFLSSSIE